MSTLLLLQRIFSSIIRIAWGFLKYTDDWVPLPEVLINWSDVFCGH